MRTREFIDLYGAVALAAIIIALVTTFAVASSQSTPAAVPSGKPAGMLAAAGRTGVPPVSVPGEVPSSEPAAPVEPTPAPTPTPSPTPTPTPPPVTGGGEGGPRFIDPNQNPTPPTVRWMEPFNQSVVNGTVKVRVRVSAAFSATAEYVQFSVDGQPISGEITTWGDELSGKCDVSCFFVLWDTTRVANGPHTISARARLKGQDGTASVTVTVNNTASTNTGSTNNTNQTAPPPKPTGRVGTLSVSSEGYLYILGKGYIGRNTRIIKLYAGVYTVYAVAPTTGKVCWAKKATVTGGKTTTMRISGIYCR